MGPRRISHALVGVVLGGTVSLALAAQTPPTQKRETPVFGVGVSLVAVPVFVTDKSGKGVGGLTVEDFEVEDEGKKVSIAAFQAIDVDTPVDAETERSMIAELPLAVQAAATRQFMLLIDSRFSPRKGLYFGKWGAASYVRESLTPGDLVAVATTGPAGLRVHTNFTRDHEFVANVIAGISTFGSPGSDPLGFSSGGASGSLGSMVSDPMDMGRGISAGGGGGDRLEAELRDLDVLLAQANGRATENATTGFLGDLESLVQRLAPIRGRKQIVLFSGGFPDGDTIFGRILEIARKAGRADVVIHTVDLNGITEAVDLTGLPSLNDIGEASPGPRKQHWVSPGRDTLTALSLKTGGRPIPPGNDFKMLFGEVDRVSRLSYVIAFEALDAEGGSNRPRKLKVRVRRRGLTVSHRPEYSISTPKVTPASSVEGQAREAIAKGLSGGPLRLHLTTLPYRDDAGKQSVSAVLRISGTAFTEAAHGRELAVQVYGYAMSSGRVLDGIALNTSIDLSKSGEAVRASGLNIVTAFPVSTGNVDLRFFVRAGTSEATGSIQRNVAVPAFAADEGVLSAPMFPMTNAGQIVFPFQPQSRASIGIPFHVGGDRFVPDAAVTLKPGWSREACVFVWRARNEPTGTFTVTAELIRSGQAPVPVHTDGPPRIVPDADGFDRYLFSLATPVTASGDYTLRLTFAEVGSGRTSRTEASVVVVE